VLPDLHIEVTHSYDVPGCSLREMTASGTHSAEFAGIPPTGRHVTWEAIALYIFDDQEPDKLIGERAYWDNDALMKRMRGEEAPPLLGLLRRGGR
jgi:predicted ester cyclase